MKMREFGRLYKPTYRDRKTGELKHSPTWWIAYYHRGKEHRESSQSTDPKAARRLLKKRIGEMGRGAFVGPNEEKVTAEDLCTMVLDDYRVNGRKSLKRLEGAVAHLKGAFALSRAVDITTDKLTTYIRTRQEAGAMPATIRYELAILKRGFSLTLRAGWLAHRPYIPSIEVRNVRTGFFERAEFEAVRSRLSDAIRPIMTFAYLTGWRIRSEVLPLQWRQVDFAASVVRLEPGTTKNDEGRTFPFGVIPELAAVLREQWERTKALEQEKGQVIPAVFHRDGRPIRDFRKVWAQACTAAGVPGKIPHDFRRTAVRNLERAGVPRSVAMKLTGHKTESVYRRYAIVSEADLSEGVAKLAALHRQPASGPQTIPGQVVPIKTRKAGGKQTVGE